MLAALQSGLVAREPRKAVLVPSRMRGDGGWIDVCIHNISSRGMMVGSDAPPAPGTYVDIRRGSLVIIGRAVWRKGRFFGVRTQDRIDIAAIVNEPRLAGKPNREALSDALEAERRSSDRLAVEAKAARRLERSRTISSALQFGLIGLAGVCGAGFAALQVYEMLAAPAAAVGAAMAGDG